MKPLPEDKTDKRPILLIGILFVGILLRIYDISTESLWLDEGISIARAKFSPVHLFERLSLSTHQPFYYLILHYWVALFGDSAFSVRALSSVFGILSVLMMYKVAAKIFDRDVGLLSALIMSLSVFHIWYSQEARNYSLMTLLALVSMYYFLKLFLKTGLKNSIGYIIPSCLLLYTHYFGIFIIVAQNLSLITTWLLSQERNKIRIRSWFLLQGMLVIFYLPWLAMLKVQASLWQKGLAMNWIPVPTVRSVYESFQVYAGSSSLLLLFTALAIFSCIQCQKRNAGEQGRDCPWTEHWPDVTRVSLLIAWLFIPVLLPFLLSFFLKPMYVTRFTIPASLPFYILVAKGIQNIKHSIMKVPVILLLIGLSAVSVWEYYGKVDKQQWREAARYIDNNAQKGDVIIFIPGDPERLIYSYYSQRKDVVRKQFPPILSYDKESMLEYLPALTEDSEKVWLVVSLNKDPQGIMRDILNRFGYALVYKVKYDGNGALPAWSVIDIFLFAKNQRR